MDILLMLAIALAADLLLGEPPLAVHPVAWMGKVVAFLEKGGAGRPPRVQLVYGCAMTLAAAGLFTAPVYFLLFYLKSVSFVAYVIAGAAILKCAFSVKELRRSALRIKELLLKENLEKARFELRSLASRDAADLPPPLIVSATVESTAENASDSFVAPLFYFLLLGVPGAIAYRVVNTMDAMIGYHGRYEYLGKFASRLDDVLNFVPARLTALLIVVAAFFSGGNASAAWRIAIRDHSRTESPNAGWPMAAAAGALGVQLEKAGHYRLGEPGSPLTPGVIDGALRITLVAMLSWAVVCLIAGGIRFAVTT